MLAARFHEAGAPFVVEEIPEPEAGPGEVLVDVRAASLCGSDAHYQDDDSDFDPRTTPLTLGHEGAGVVEAVGEGVDHVAPGDRVAIHYVSACGDCKPCLAGSDNRCRNRESIGSDLDGTFAERIAVPEHCAVPMGDVSFEWGSIASCAVATAYHAVERADVGPGDTVAVFGVGGVGLHATLWAAFRGAGQVIAVDPVEPKLEGARAYGADLTVDPTDDDPVEAIRDATDGWGADVTLECSGSPDAMAAAIEAVNGGNQFESGTAVSVGLQHEPLSATYWGLREGGLLVSGDHTRGELRTILDLLENGRVDLSESITHRVSLDEINEGIALLDAAERVGRVIVEL